MLRWARARRPHRHDRGRSRRAPWFARGSAGRSLRDAGDHRGSTRPAAARKRRRSTQWAAHGTLREAATHPLSSLSWGLFQTSAPATTAPERPLAPPGNRPRHSGVVRSRGWRRASHSRISFAPQKSDALPEGRNWRPAAMGMERQSRPRRENDPMGRMGKRLSCVALALLALAAGGSISVAAAEPPSITIASPSDGTVINDQTPSFSGTTDDVFDEVVLSIYAGTAVGTPLERIGTSFPPVEGTWSLEPTAPLSDGVYTAQAAQTNLLLETGRSEPPVT